MGIFRMHMWSCLGMCVHLQGKEDIEYVGHVSKKAQGCGDAGLCHI